MSTPLEIVNSVFSRLGADTIAAFTDENDRADLATRNYTTLKSAYLLEHPWRFTLTWSTITKDAVANPEAAPSPHLYTLPDSMIGLPLAIQGSARQENRRNIRNDWDVIQSRKLRTIRDEGDSLFLKHQVDVDEAHWPADFSEYVICALCEKWALAVTDDEGVQAKWMRMAAEAKGRALTNDEKGTTPLQAVLDEPFAQPFREG